MAIDYKLDDLGWFEFEQLVQTLVKVRLGMGVEAWGGRGDWGCDAYFNGTLRYPTNEETNGPFVFQCKFVESANAAGAKPEKMIVAAVQKECGKIQLRLKRGRWATQPNCYGLFTNAPFTPELRETIRALLATVLPHAHIAIHDGGDLCQWLRLTPRIARSFPQLLSLRDLQELLRDTVHSGIIARSRQAIAMAQTYARTFVPTGAYFLAQERLATNGFVVLEGPPEMGKTTIGRVLALTQIACGWEAIECRSPLDVLKMYRRGRRQVFVADDFFGRTEYEPMRVSEWQSELAYILPDLGRTHWLILTCRAHLLQMAKTALDIPDQNQRFPGLGEVVVNAGNLTPLERARIVYRHAKAVDLSASAREMIKRHAAEIVNHAHFTPERVRRLLEDLASEHTVSQDAPVKGSEGSQTGTARCKESIEFMSRLSRTLSNPTQQMRVSFRRLPVCHRWMLFALLEADQNRHAFEVGSRVLQARYDALCPADAHQPYERVLAELTEAFVRKSAGFSGDRIDWIHPSCRDLSIDELSEHTQDRARFLENCEESGIILAVSLAGGARGLRQLPLVQTENDWRCFAVRVHHLVEQKPRVLCAVWKSYQIIEKQAGHDGTLLGAVARLTGIIGEELAGFPATRLGQLAYSDLRSLETFLEISNEMGTSLAIDFREGWADCAEDVKRWVEKPEAIWEDHEVPARVAGFLRILSTVHPQCLVETETRQQLDDILDVILERAATDESSRYGSPTDADDAANRASGFEMQRKSFKELADIPLWNRHLQKTLRECATHFQVAANSLWEEVPPEQDDDDRRGENPSAPDANVEVSDLFRDL